MQAQEFDDGEYQPLPPVKLPQLPPVVVRKPEQSIMAIPNLYKEEIQQVDTSSIESVQFLSGGALLAVGCGSGSIKIVSPAQGNVQFVLQGGDKSPVTGLAHNPNQSNIKHAFMATHSEGTLEYWHATSRQLLFSKKYTEMLQTCEISNNGNYYAFSGGEGHIWFGHLNKGDPVEMEDGHMGKHENRVFCLKWNPSDENVVASGGWDRSVHFWDVRMKTSIKQLFGYYIGGEAIDFRGNEVLLGNNKSDVPLRIYDTKADKVRVINWPLTRISQINDTTGVLGGSKDIIACTPRNQVRQWSEVKWVSQFQKELSVNEEGEASGVRLYCMQHSDLSGGLVTGWSDGCLRWLSL